MDYSFDAVLGLLDPRCTSHRKPPAGTAEFLSGVTRKTRLPGHVAPVQLTSLTYDLDAALTYMKNHSAGISFGKQVLAPAHACAVCVDV